MLNDIKYKSSANREVYSDKFLQEKRRKIFSQLPNFIPQSLE